MDRYLFLYPLALLVLALWGARISREGKITPDYLSPASTRMLRAVACLGIILHHLAQQVTGYGLTDKGLITVFNDIGFLLTGLFFFFSGYGLLVSFETKPDYLRTFLPKRLPAVLIPFWLVNLLGILWKRFAYGIRPGVVKALKELLGILLINSNGWFIIEIVILYLLFYLLFRFLRDKDTALVLLCLMTLLLIAYGFSRGHDLPGSKTGWFRGEWWYNSTIAFIFGLVYARFRAGIGAFCAKHAAPLLCVYSVLLVVTLRGAMYTVRRYGYYRTDALFSGRREAAVTLAVQSIAVLVFVSFVLLVHLYITPGNRILRFLGRVSPELFLVHGYFVEYVFGHVRTGNMGRFALVFGGSVLIAALLSPLDRILAAGAARFLTAWTGRLRGVGKGCGDMPPVSQEEKGLRETAGTMRTQAASKKASAMETKPELTLEGKQLQEKRTRRKKRLLRAAAVFAAILTALFVYLNLRTRWEYREECADLRTAQIGDEVCWGRFEMDYRHPGTERVRWIVIHREEDLVCLLCREGIAGSSYHQRHEAVTWEESDLRALLNSKAFTGMFSAQEAEAVVEKDGDELSLLSVSEAMEAFSTDEERELVITPDAEAKGTNINRLSKANYWDMKGYRSSWWWLKGETGAAAFTAPIVTEDGTICLDVKEVNRPGGAVRPVLWVRIPPKPE